MRQLLGTVSLSCGFLIIFYHFVLTAPNQTLFSLEGDGLKNYYTFLYHLKYDRSFLHFEGLNYPYGEHIFYTDAQPLLVNSVKWISSNLVDLSRYGIGVLNLSLLFMLLPASAMLFLILRRFSLPAWYAMPAAVGITFLSPQVLRFGGHYSLGYVAAIPLAWYLALRFFEKPNYGISFLIALNSLLWGAIHPYYLYIFSIFFLALWMAQLNHLRNSRSIFQMLIQILLPGLLMALGLLATDPYLGGRPYPLDSRYYHATPASVFLPSYPTFGIQSDFLVHWGEPQSEGIAYVGATGLLGLILLGILLIRSVKCKRLKKLARPTRFRLLNNSLFAALLLLVFSLGYPLYLMPDSVLEIIPPLNQFRSVGRLAWVFYYVFSIFAFYLTFIASRSMRRLGWRRGARLLLGIALTGIVLEAGIQNRTVSNHINHRLTDSGFCSEDFQWIEQLDVKSYQAIVPVPYYHIGSEKVFRFAGSSGAIYYSMMASLKTGLPLTSVFMSRTPMEQARRSVSFFEQAGQSPSILDDLPDSRPFLILATHEALKPEEQALLKKATLLFENPALRLYKFSTEEHSGRP
ncbi:MAG: hypothetical protein HY645_01000 [Acidobacteria bacterium]|nr:hypothetical protein [Acidobacteriota bacterium]